jgi:hypothetical protein
MKEIIILLILFGIKHFVCDFVLQNNKMIKDKGTYLAPGGVRHALEHAAGTFAVLVLALPWDPLVHVVAVALGLLDGVVHYHIDYLKTNLSRGLTPADQKFWVYLGADQGLHYATYVAIIATLVLV